MRAALSCLARLYTAFYVFPGTTAFMMLFVISGSRLRSWIDLLESQQTCLLWRPAIVPWCGWLTSGCGFLHDSFPLISLRLSSINALHRYSLMRCMTSVMINQWYICINLLLMESRNESILVLAISWTYLSESTILNSYSLCRVS